MGMFDELKCKLPIGRDPDTVYQTKDIQNQFYTYEIAENGLLYLVKEGFMHSIHSEACRFPVPIDGILLFYTYSDQEEWIEFEAIFKKDICVTIRRPPWPYEPGRKWVSVWPATNDSQDHG